MSRHNVRRPARVRRRSIPFKTRLAELRARAGNGDASAFWQLGCLLDEGDVDGAGRVRVPPNRRGAFAAYRRGAALGDAAALLNLGVCYDNGEGTRRDRGAAWQCYQRVWRRTGDGAAANNLATWHRDAGNQSLAFSWYEKAASAGDGDAQVSLAYSYYYGIGVTRDAKRAVRSLDRADRAESITPLGREEAQYLRAVILLDRQPAGDIDDATALLRKAAADGDYPEAVALLDDLAQGETLSPCRCRRHWKRALGGQVACPLHRRHRRRA